MPTERLTDEQIAWWVPKLLRALRAFGYPKLQRDAIHRAIESWSKKRSPNGVIEILVHKELDEAMEKVNVH